MASLVKTVEMRILVDAGDAQAKLDDMDAKAKDLDGNAIKMRFRLDDGEGKAQLDAIQAKADKLGYKDVSIKVRIDGAGRAIAELDAVKHEEDAVRDKGLMNKLSGMLSSGAPDLAGAGNIPFVGGLAGAGGGAGLIAIIPLVEAALVEVTGLVSGFAAAGAGAGAFYLLAHPAISNLTGDVKALGAANQAVGFAQQTEKIDPTKAHLAALKNAQVKYQAIYQQMGQDAGPAAAGMLKLHDTYTKLSTAFAPDAFKVFNAGLKVANSLLPATVPFAKTFASSLAGLLDQLGKVTQSKGFAQFLDQFHSLEGPAIAAIGQGIGKVASAVGQLLTSMSGKDVAQTIGIAFNAIAGSIGFVAHSVRQLMTDWDDVSSAAKRMASAVSGAWKSIVSSAESAYTGVMSAWHSMLSGIASVIGDIVHAVEGLAGRIRGAVSGFGHLLWDAGVALIQGLISGIESMMGGLLGVVGKIAGFIASHKGPIDADRVLLVPHGQAIMQGLMYGIGSEVPALRSQLTGITGTISKTVGTGHGGGGNIEVHFNGLVTSPQDTARQVVQVLKEYKRNGGNAALGIA